MGAGVYVELPPTISEHVIHVGSAGRRILSKVTPADFSPRLLASTFTSVSCLALARWLGLSENLLGSPCCSLTFAISKDFEQFRRRSLHDRFNKPTRPAFARLHVPERHGKINVGEKATRSVTLARLNLLSALPCERIPPTSQNCLSISCSRSILLTRHDALVLCTTVTCLRMILGKRCDPRHQAVCHFAVVIWPRHRTSPGNIDGHRAWDLHRAVP